LATLLTFDNPSSLHPIHDRHHVVHENDLELAASSFSDHIDGFLSIVGDLTLGLELDLQDILERRSVEDIIINYED